MKLLHLGCGDDIIPGFDNLDQRINGWTFEAGLPYPDQSVNGITISHALMYVEPNWWPFVFDEMFRVLRPGGVVRITEDDTESPASARFGILYPGAKAATGPNIVRWFLERAGFHAHDCKVYESTFETPDLLIAHRERNPWFVFYIEGARP